MLKYYTDDRSPTMRAYAFAALLDRKATGLNEYMVYGMDMAGYTLTRSTYEAYYQLMDSLYYPFLNIKVPEIEIDIDPSEIEEDSIP